MRDRFLGVLERVVPGKTGPVGKLRPLIALWEDGSLEPLSHSAVMEQFPNTGQVSWYGMPAEIARDTLWWFSSSETRQFDPSKPSHDQMQVDPGVEPAKEVLDCRDFGDLNGVRQILTGRGLSLQHTPGEAVYLWVQGNEWVGPVPLVPHPTVGNQWRIDSVILQTPLMVGPAPAPECFVRVTIGGEARWIVLPGARIASALHLDWASDDVLLKRVLRWIRSNEIEFTESLRLTQSTIDHMVERLREHSGLGLEEGGVHGYRLKRARQIVAELGQRANLVEQIVQDMLHLPRVQAAVAAQVEDLAVAARERAVQTVAEALAARGKELSELEAKIGQRWAEFEDTDRMIAEERKTIDAERQRLHDEAAVLEARRETLRHEFEERVQQLVAQPGALLADLAILRLVAPALQTPAVADDVKRDSSASEHRKASLDAVVSRAALEEAPRANPDAPIPASGAVARSIRTWLSHRDDVLLETLLDSRRSLRTACRAAGVSAPAALVTHAALLAGLCPVVAGLDALELLETYAQVITSGRICWVPISPTVLEPLDLLGRPDSNGHMVRHPAGLLDLLIHAKREPEMLTLVVMDGITRAPVDTYLTPILAWQMSGVHGRVARRFPLCHADALAPDDKFAGHTLMSWPPNVLLAATLGRGSTMVPAGAELWSRAAYIPLFPGAAEGEDGLEAQESSAVSRSGVSATQWGSWKREVLVATSTLVQETLEQFPPEFGLPRDAAGERLMSAVAAILGHSPSGALDSTRTFCLSRLLPHAVSNNVWDRGEGVFESLAKADSQLGPAIRQSLALLSSGLTWP